MEESNFNEDVDVLFPKHELRESLHIYEEIAYTVLGTQRTNKQKYVGKNFTSDEPIAVNSNSEAYEPIDIDDAGFSVRSESE